MRTVLGKVYEEVSGEVHAFPYLIELFDGRAERECRAIAAVACLARWDNPNKIYPMYCDGDYCAGCAFTETFGDPDEGCGRRDNGACPAENLCNAVVWATDVCCECRVPDDDCDPGCLNVRARIDWEAFVEDVTREAEHARLSLVEIEPILRRLEEEVKSRGQ